ncbi:MAG: bifunctional phosphopantothenoylcysteine decarboxylase/phosphopantothenate--cysteine ligase CoaBC [Acidobacteriota bacterium]|nr:bifunctional phosphopantothenoylcysteine decarboxylase/phosphopantothenate--cysteine ligase CoaBC [Acidobacteriota bacterium]
MRILLGISGGVAAFKAPTLVRRLRERGHEVRCALSGHAPSFVTPLTLEVVSGHPVYDSSYLEANGSGEELHITAAQWADVLCIAPATANTLGRLALGLAEDFVSTTVLAFDGPVAVAPAMHPAMWEKESVQDNVRTLRSRGVRLLGPVQGSLASGEVGWGRMVEPEEIAEAIDGMGVSGSLSGRRVVVSAGPTFEPVDPVRFLGNRSSGKMGFSIAAEAAARGAEVVLVAGPVSLETPDRVRRIDVCEAVEMADAVRRESANAALIVMAAAVSDYRPKTQADQKIKKEDAGIDAIRLTENPDILASLADWAPNALRVGFAAETQDLDDNVRSKLERKGAHFLVGNDVSRSDIGFGSDENEVTVFGADGSAVEIEKGSKTEIARRLLDLLEGHLDLADESVARS